MRRLLRNKLEAGKNNRKWDHITKQIGMFCYTGLTKDQVSLFLLTLNLLTRFIRWHGYKRSSISTVLRMVASLWPGSTQTISITYPLRFFLYCKSYYESASFRVSSRILFNNVRPRRRENSKTYF